nr:PREDICTED: rust resistance kinase Lr10-like [Daucus carota subsp. sativus]
MALRLTEKENNMRRKILPSVSPISTKHSLLFIFIFTIIVSSLSSYCCEAAASPSSCGNIRNISCPFKLQGDRQKCDSSFFTQELSCRNNRTILYLLPDKLLYYVQSINYDNLSIRIVDPGVRKNNPSSRPLRSLTEEDLQQSAYRAVFYEDGSISGTGPMLSLSELNQPIAMIECPSPVTSNRYINTTSPTSSYTSSVFGKDYIYAYAYMVVGFIPISELKVNCRISKLAWVSLRAPSRPSISSNMSAIHDAMLYGFEIPWSYFYCLKCDATLSGEDSCDTQNRDYHHWACKNYDSHCNVGHLSSYNLTISCIRKNIHDIVTSRKNQRAIGIYFGVRFFLGLLLLLAVVAYRARRRHLSMYNTIEDFLQAQNNLMPIRYAYSDIKKMTNNFGDKLGEGGFGTVYKGKLRSGLFVAVKILGKSSSTGQEFINEVATSGRIHHVNVVELLGFCFEGSKRALIYEFMPNGSLEKYIFCKEGTEEEIASLSWIKMYDISCKVASGIDYLHRGCDMQILHFDIKPHNILLDKNFNPIISDFGLAKSYATDDSIVTLTAARGTMGYMAPEMFYKNIGGISYKADVYSFGMLLMEMAGRRKNSNPFVDHVSQVHFPSWVYNQFSEGKELEMEDVTQEERKLVKKMIIVALWCIQMKPSDRPPMNKVIEMLEGPVEHLVMPPKPFLYTKEDPAEIKSSSTQSFLKSLQTEE